MDNRPIGVFDSGLGGASVLCEALRLLPQEDYIYYGDNLNAPYGDRSEAEITQLTMRCAKELVSHGVKAILLGCNTATATCINRIREELSLPVVSIEPAIKPASMLLGNGKILMAATTATTKLKRYLALQQRMPVPERIINVPCSGLVERIEAGILGAEDFNDILEARFSLYDYMQIDAIVLGCTHFIFIKEAFAHYARMHFRGEARLFDGNAATVMQLGHVLDGHHIRSLNGNGKVEFLTSGNKERIEPIFRVLLERQI